VASGREAVGRPLLADGAGSFCCCCFVCYCAIARRAENAALRSKVRRVGLVSLLAIAMMHILYGRSGRSATENPATLSQRNVTTCPAPPMLVFGTIIQRDAGLPVIVPLRWRRRGTSTSR
jgi:hypothetical protein